MTCIPGYGYYGRKRRAVEDEAGKPVLKALAAPDPEAIAIADPDADPEAYYGWGRGRYYGGYGGYYGGYRGYGGYGYWG